VLVLAPSVAPLAGSLLCPAVKPLIRARLVVGAAVSGISEHSERPQERETRSDVGGSAAAPTKALSG
jgi:hypothetical protein